MLIATTFLGPVLPHLHTLIIVAITTLYSTYPHYSSQTTSIAPLSKLSAAHQPVLASSIVSVLLPNSIQNIHFLGNALEMQPFPFLVADHLLP